jgi:hypothetical protein
LRKISNDHLSPTSSAALATGQFGRVPMSMAGCTNCLKRLQQNENSLHII